MLCSYLQNCWLYIKTHNYIFIGPYVRNKIMWLWWLYERAVKRYCKICFLIISILNYTKTIGLDTGQCNYRCPLVSKCFLKKMTLCLYDVRFSWYMAILKPSLERNVTLTLYLKVTILWQHNLFAMIYHHVNFQNARYLYILVFLSSLSTKMADLNFCTPISPERLVVLKNLKLIVQRILYFK